MIAGSPRRPQPTTRSPSQPVPRRSVGRASTSMLRPRVIRNGEVHCVTLGGEDRWTATQASSIDVDGTFAP